MITILDIFHSIVVIYRRINYIGHLKNDEGNWIYDLEDIRNFILQKLKKIYMASSHIVDIDLFPFVWPCITEEENMSLCEIPIFLEIIFIVKSMHPITALGPDGMPTIFFQKYWDCWRRCG